MRSSLFTAVFLSAFVNVAIGDEPARSGNEIATIVPAEWKALHDRWQAAVDELKIPGVAIVVVKGNDIVLLDTIGVCDPAGKQKVTPRSPFYLASVTKSFTALGVAILVEEGKVKLDEPVQTYLPRFTLSDPQLAAKVTIRDLLAHRHGLNSQPITMAEAYFGNINDERYYHLLKAVRSPGRFAYSNLHYTLLGRVIEAVTGKPWKDFLAERVFAPIAMTDATCYASKLYANPLAAWPMVERSGGFELASQIKNDSVMHAAGGMGCSAADLANWLRFHLSGKTPDGRRLLSEDLLREVHTRQATDDRAAAGRLSGILRDGYSLGWFTGNFHGHPMLEHGGGYLGTATSVSFLPDDSLGVAVLVNGSRPMFPMLVTSDIYAKLLGVAAEDLLPAMLKNAAAQRERDANLPQDPWAPPTAENGLVQPIERYTGTYENPVWGDATVEAADGKLALQIGNLRVRWHALGNERFRIEITPGDQFDGSFKVGGDGKVEALIVQTPLGGTRFDKIK